jgi:hypothetical protein
LDTGAVKVPLDFRVDDAAPNVVWLTTRARGDVAAALTGTEGRVSFRLPEFDVAIDVLPDGERLTGACRHAGAEFPMTFSRPPTAPAAPPLRAQTPRRPFPYDVEEIVVEGAAGDRICGTLTMPGSRSTAHPAVILSTWFGRADRDQTVAGHKPFAIWADALTRLGFAVFRYDKRGAGASGGRFSATNTHDLAADLERIVAYLRGSADVDPAKIGLVGHSEGGHISAMVAAEDPRISFCVMMTPTGVSEETIYATDLFRAAIAVGGRPLQPETSIRRTRRLARSPEPRHRPRMRSWPRAPFYEPRLTVATFRKAGSRRLPCRRRGVITG